MWDHENFHVQIAKHFGGFDLACVPYVYHGPLKLEDHRKTAM